MYTVISNMIFTHYQSNGITLTHCVLKYSYIYVQMFLAVDLFTVYDIQHRCVFVSFEISTLTELAINCLTGSDWR